MAAIQTTVKIMCDLSPSGYRFSSWYAKDYTDAGLPWFDYYSDQKALTGADRLGGLKSIGAMNIEEGKGPSADNDPVVLKVVKTLGTGILVRDGEF